MSIIIEPRRFRLPLPAAPITAGPLELYVASVQEASTLPPGSIDAGIALIDPGMSPAPAIAALPAGRRLVLEFNDFSIPAADLHRRTAIEADLRRANPSWRLPTMVDVAFVLSFGRRLRREGRRLRVLIHCHAGISRSPAAALALLADALGPGREAEAVETIYASIPCCLPNSLMVRDADRLLGAGGRLAAASEERGAAPQKLVL